MTSTREQMLASIRAASGRTGPAVAAAAPAGSSAHAGPAADEVPGWRLTSELAGQPLLDLLAERLADYRALVTQVRHGELAESIAAALLRRGARSVIVPDGLGLPLPDSVTVTTDTGHLTAPGLDVFEAVITRAAVAIAETGTIVLDGGPGQGRRAISLVPDYHLCVVNASQVVHLVPEAVARLRPAAGRPLTWISGPSATSDIELERVEGVHGPRTIEVLIVAD